MEDDIRWMDFVKTTCHVLPEDKAYERMSLAAFGCLCFLCYLCCLVSFFLRFFLF
ncbi:hypothetical protein J3E68DRAFT_404219 [Trichoderma sp. SZMC 28012]